MAKDKTRRSRIKSGKTAQQRPDARDYHHICYQRRHWDGFWAKQLREHPYMGAVIPMHTLHKKIHETIHDIPCPNEDVCELVFYELEDLTEREIVNVNRDNLELRIAMLIELLEHCDGELDATIATLRWQKQIVRKFYQASH